VVTGYSELVTAPPPPDTLQAPTLLVHALEFGLVRPEQVETYGALPNVEVVAVPGAHIVYWDAYEQTADAIDRFLEDSLPQR
jgi:pimeloyl-ACP methyl ester carboxylesterase